MPTTNNDGMKVKCQHKDCKYEWDYNGKKTLFVTCPNCQRKTRISEEAKEQ